MTTTNSTHYNLDKAVEELNELSTAIMQYKLKNGRKTTSQDVIDEIGDVKIRLKVLEKMFGKKNIKKRVKLKLSKFKGYFDTEKYIGKI